MKPRYAIINLCPIPLPSAVDGDLFTFGERDGGKLGLRPEQLAHHRVPQPVRTITDRVVQVACGGGHTVALTGRRTDDGLQIRLGVKASLWTPEPSTMALARFAQTFVKA